MCHTCHVSRAAAAAPVVVIIIPDSRDLLAFVGGLDRFYDSSKLLRSYVARINNVLCDR